MPIVLRIYTIEIKQCQEMGWSLQRSIKSKSRFIDFFLIRDITVFCILIRMIRTNEKIDDAREGWDSY